MSNPNQPQIQQAIPIAYLPPQVAEEEINLLDLWRVLVREKWLIFLFTILCTTGAVVMALYTAPIYRAEVLLEPITETGKQGGGLLSQYGGLAAMAGIDIGGSSGTKDTALAKLQSRVFVREFLNDEKLLPILFHEKWNPQTKSWQVKDPKNIPTMWNGVNAFNKILNISENKKTGLITLAIEWHDREAISRWANLLVERINRHLRMLAVKDAKKNLAYLYTELAGTQIVEVQQAIARLLETQIKTIMLANVRTEFAFKVIDPAVVPPEGQSIRPKRRLMVVLGFILGVFMGIVAAFFRNFLRQIKA